MCKIVGIGANVHDTLITLNKFPNEDTKLKAESICEAGGGPCATGLVAAHKLGAESAFIGALADDSAGNFLMEDMRKRGMSTDLIKIEKGYSTFSSCVWLSTENASRTCVFHRGNVPPLKLSDKQIKAIEDAEILMVDGNELEAAIEGAKIARKAGTKVLYDAGGLYEGIERLLPYADILIPSEEFSLGFTGAKTVEEAAEKLMKEFSPEALVITSGKIGGIILEKGEIKRYNAFKVDAVDTNGAGDVFHGAYAFAVTKGYDYYKCCTFSSAVSAIKCTNVGARDSVPSFSETIKFLKERGRNEFEEDMD